MRVSKESTAQMKLDRSKHIKFKEFCENKRISMRDALGSAVVEYIAKYNDSDLNYVSQLEIAGNSDMR